MNITASQVQQSCVTSQVLEQKINVILKTFQASIIDASKNGLTSVNLCVPTNFSIGNMDNKTAQTIIYGRLIQELEDKEFNVKISMSTSSVTYYVRWDVETDSGDLKHMRTNIAQHLIQEDIN
jgi:hypothetical protein